MAPDIWRKKAEELKKNEQERKKYEDRMDFNAKLAYASASKEERRGEKWKPLRPAAKDWEEVKEEFEKVEKLSSWEDC